MTSLVNNLAFVLLLCATLFLRTLSNPAFNDDVLGLVVFKAGLHDTQGKLTSWNEEDDTACHWHGVTCDPTTQRVTAVNLDGFGLSGHVNRGLLRLQGIQRLSLSNNNLTGSINPDLAHIGTLQVIDLSWNGISGVIPDEFFGQCGSLREVNFAGNELSGRIPESLSLCNGLVKVDFSSNRLSGRLPSGIWYLRGLKELDLSWNLLEGDVHEGIGYLYDLRAVNLAQNRFSGWLPRDVGGCSHLRVLDFSDNFFSGGVPESVKGLGLCKSLCLKGNLLSGEVPSWIGEMRRLRMLDLSCNNFSGGVPATLGNLRLLEKLDLAVNGFSGSLPDALSNCFSLLSLDVSRNQLAGKLPSWILRLGAGQGKQEFNPLRPIAASHGGIQVLDLSSNAFSDVLPSDIGVLSSLQFLNVSRNQLVGSIPASIGNLKAVYVVDLSDNRLNGSIPSEIGGAVSLKELRLHNNFLTGNLPSEIEKCSSLSSLLLSQNNLSGSVPAAIANLTNLQYVDLSLNQFSGNLPEELTNLSHILYFNVSYNHLEGELPVGGFFDSISPSSIMGNPSLCGSVLNAPCPADHPKPIVLNPNSNNTGVGSSSSLNHAHKNVFSISALISIGAAAFIAIGVIAVTVLNMHVRSSMMHSAPLPLLGVEGFSCSPSPDSKYGKLVMFSGDADFAAGAQALLNKECELGRGGFGVVYRTVLRDGRPVAIKKLTVSSLIKSQEDFEKEVKRLGKIRHCNLVTLEGYYWTPSLQLLIYDYIQCGSLYKNLHDGDDQNVLSWRQRFNIILGMAKGLAHLHQKNMIHYNLKSTNILIDSSGEPKIGDSGLTKLLPMLDRCILSSKIQSALGYMAPEFACQTVKITEKCDVYGFGVLVLEVVSGKRPVEYMEDDVVILCDMVRGALEAGNVEECLDRKLVGNYPEEEGIPLIKLGLICASQVPSNRPDMSEVVNILELIQCPSEGHED